MVAYQSDRWPIQDAKQRFSEVIRAVEADGPQIITRHGEEVAVIIDMAGYHRLTQPAVNLTEVLLGGPKFDDDVLAVFEEIEAERKKDFGRAIDFGEDA